MSLKVVLASVLALAVVVAWIRLLVWHRRSPGPRSRLAALLLLQPVCAGLLYLTFLPPKLAVQAGTMTVLTAGAQPGASAVAGEVVVALPEAPESPDAERAPDLATALRRHPGTARLQVIGLGLDPRDREAANGLAVAFDPPPPAPGLAALQAPARVVPGSGFDVNGRVEALDGGQVRLLDPAGQVVDAAVPDDSGRFHLRGHVRAPGLATFALDVLDAEGGEVDAVPVPLEVVTGPALRVLLLGGAPGPEFRHLRRWAGDAGLDLHADVAVGRGIGLGDGPAPARAEGFGEYDLVILDGRALGALGPARRDALAQALGAGTGVLLRLDGEVPASARAWFADLGMALTDDGRTSGMTLPAVDDPARLRARLGPGTADVPFDPALAGEAPPELLRREVQPEADDAVGLSAPGQDAPYAWWRQQGRGRVGLWTLLDSHRLALAGRGDLHGELWSSVVATLARPVERAAPDFEAMPRATRRMTICGLDADEATVIAPDATRSAVLVDPGAGPDGCAAYWPQSEGWHLLEMEDRAWPFRVFAAGVAPGLAGAGLRTATLAMVGDGDPGGVTVAAARSRRGPSWPWFLGWLGTSGLLWWLERRRRRGRP